MTILCSRCPPQATLTSCRSDPEYDKTSSPKEIKARLNIAFNGYNEDTGWYSLHDFYDAASYSALNINDTIMDIYRTGDAYDLSSAELNVCDWRYLLNAVTYYNANVNYEALNQNGGA